MRSKRKKKERKYRNTKKNYRKVQKNKEKRKKKNLTKFSVSILALKEMLNEVLLEEYDTNFHDTHGNLKLHPKKCEKYQKW